MLYRIAKKSALQTRTQNMRFHHLVFTGKEKDEETGYGYFGARYMDYNILTSFLSVDRYASKYPSISPYVYCAWNPIRLTDPSGDTIINQYLQYKNSKGSQGDLYARTQKLIDEFQSSYPEEFDYLNNLSFTDANGESTPVNIIVGVSDKPSPRNPETGALSDGQTFYSFKYSITDYYDSEKNLRTQIKEINGIKDDKFSITLYKHHHNIRTLANEFGDVIFAIMRPQTADEQKTMCYGQKSTSVFSYDYEAYIKGERMTRPDPLNRTTYK